MTQPVLLFEPDVEILRACLMIHDFTGKQGPIAQERFYWFVGPHWQQPFSATVQQEPLPGTAAAHDPTAPARAEVLRSVQESHGKRSAEAEHLQQQGNEITRILLQLLFQVFCISCRHALATHCKIVNIHC